MNAKRKVAIGCASLGLLAVLIVAIALWKFSADSSNELKTEIQKTKAEGYWVENISDLVHPISERNAADLYNEIFPTIEGLKLPNLSSYTDPANRSKVDEYMKKIEPVLKKARETLRYPLCQFKHSYDDLNELYPELTHFKPLVRGFAIAAYREKNPDRAIEDLRIAAKVAHDAGQEPTLIANLIQISCEAIVLREFERQLTRNPNKTSQLEGVLKELGNFPDTLLSYKAEMVLIRKSLSRPLSSSTFGDNPEPQQRTALYLSHFEPIRQRWQATVVRQYRKLMEGVGQDARISHVMQVNEQVSNHVNDNFEMSMLMPDFSNSFFAIDKGIAQRRMAWEALEKVKRHDLSLTLPIQGEQGQDPFNDKPLSIKKINGGFRIYATGNEKKLLGGKRDPKNWFKGDLVFDYPLQED